MIPRLALKGKLQLQEMSHQPERKYGERNQHQRPKNHNQRRSSCKKHHQIQIISHFLYFHEAEWKNQLVQRLMFLCYLVKLAMSTLIYQKPKKVRQQRNQPSISTTQLHEPAITSNLSSYNEQQHRLIFLSQVIMKICIKVLNDC